MDKQKLALSVALIFLILAAAACSGTGKKQVKQVPLTDPSVIEVSIGGMSCTDCEQTIQTRVGALDGIKSVKASYTAGNAIVEYYPDKVDSAKIREAIVGSGYKVKKFIMP
jgi:copper chaperone CopZ